MLSDEQILILKTVLSQKEYFVSNPEPLGNQLHYLGTLGYVSLISDSNELGASFKPRYVVSEKGKAYLAQLQKESQTLDAFKSMASSAEEQAKSAKIQAALAIKAAEAAEIDAKKARNEALFSKIMAILALIVAILSPFLSEYAVTITKWLLGLF